MALDVADTAAVRTDPDVDIVASVAAATAAVNPSGGDAVAAAAATVNEWSRENLWRFFLLHAAHDRDSGITPRSWGRLQADRAMRGDAGMCRPLHTILGHGHNSDNCCSKTSVGNVCCCVNGEGERESAERAVVT